MSEFRLTAASLQPSIESCEQALRSAGIGRLGIYLENSPEWVAWDLAAQHCGITCVPLPKFFSDEQLQHSVTLAQLDAVVTDEPIGLRQRLPAYSQRLASSGAVALLRHESCAPQTPLMAHGQRIAKVTFTSGSTGRPKGVMLTQSAIDKVVNSLAQALTGIGMTRHLCLLPLPILLENVAGVSLSLQFGADVIAVPGRELGLSGSSGLDPQKLAQALDYYQPASLILLPQLLLTLTLLAEQKKITTGHFHFLAVGGAVVSPHLIERARAAGLPVYEGYGLSECASVVSLNTPKHDRVGSVGKVLPHQRVSIDQREIVVRGSDFSGYLSEVNEATVHTDHVCTGDEGTLDDDGYLYIRGRQKNILVSSFGRNIHPEWPESRLLELPCIRQAVVLGEGQPHLTALIAGDERYRPQIEQHIQHVNSELPDYARLLHWDLIPPTEFARLGLLTSNGRVKRHLVSSALPEMHYRKMP